MAPRNRSPFRRTLALLAGGAILAQAGMSEVAIAQTAPEVTAPGVAAPVPAAPLAPAAPQQTPPLQGVVPNNGPASVADLAEGLLDAVVNISTSQNVKDDEGVGPAPRAPDGSPFQEFFNDFFNKQQGGKGPNHNVSSLGSGFVIDPTGYIVTNNHVIEGADDIEVNFANGSKLKAKLIGTDTKTDLSVLKVEPRTPLKSVKFGDSSTMRIGDWVMAIGNPFGFGGSVTVGIISGRGRNINAGPYDNFIQTDAAINKGNSGGPLFNMKGEVIGINTAIISPSGGSIGIGFSVPSELASGVVEQLREYGETRRGWLGVRIQPVTDDIADSLGLDTAKGALVAGVIKGGPVDDGSIKAGDVILKFDGKTVNEMRDLPRVVAESTVGKEVDVVVLRDGKEQSVKVKLGRLEDSDQAAAGGAAPDGSQDDGVITPDPDENDDMDQPDTGDQAPPVPGAPAPDQGQVSPDATPKNVLGLSLSLLSPETRKAFGIAESVDGVVVTEVAPGSASAEKGLKPGDVIVEVAQEFMKSPDAVAAKVKSLKQEGRRNAQLMIASANGDLRFVAVPME
ncbi:serine protease Do [Rhizobium binae]|uniref:Probable periplasmic serine endoprotease DegP-like n=1 Tax=Rhizobium binae TaxID=1138190 RepID=A0ABV2M9J3_9HYPH|nr:Do family serine endopeptidase [Rhizobium binae]MBX4992070.1 Do family serine endopeptidase [Rhizobium binae]NKL49276.1 Do family serine endopeptidase [Rhizobium leguminosarum bv. viciae]QSY80947.1 Do family serine endopeptidase [Rhizobium binae]